jgi:AcrR family transcriptional regulator
MQQRRPIGRPRSIDRDKIVAAANEIGVERLTMRAVAEHLGVTTQALYNHIGGRRELLALLANDYGDAFDLPTDGGESWQSWLLAFAGSLRARLLARPGTVVSVATRGPTSPAAVRFVDRTISKMREAGFEEQEALLAYKAVLELVVGGVQRQEQRQADPDRDHAHRALFYEALTVSEPDELPNLAFIAAGWSRRDPEELFRYSLGCLLAGIDAQRGWLGRARAEVGDDVGAGGTGSGARRDASTTR